MAKEEKNLLEKFAAASQQSSTESQHTFSIKDSITEQPTSNPNPDPDLNLDPEIAPVPIRPQVSLNALDLPKICFRHLDIAGKYFCPVCNHWRCEDCVNIYASSVICPDSDSFCLTEEKTKEQVQTQIKKRIPYKTDLQQAMNFPLRYWKVTLAIWLIACLVASAMEAATTFVAGSLFITEILFGKGVGFSASITGYFVLASIANQYLINRVQGKETLQIINFSELVDLFEASMLWVCVAIITLLPIIYYLGYSSLQSALIVLITKNPINDNPLTIKFYLISFLLSAWAIVFYPITLSTAGLQRSFLSIANPITSIKVWNNYKEWLKPAFAIFYSLHAIAFLVSFLVWHQPFGLAISTLIFTLTTLISFMAIGAAIEKGAEKGAEKR